MRYFIFIQYAMNLNLLMCVTQFISTPTECTLIINYGLLIHKEILKGQVDMMITLNIVDVDM